MLADSFVKGSLVYPMLNRAENIVVLDSTYDEARALAMCFYCCCCIESFSTEPKPPLL